MKVGIVGSGDVAQTLGSGFIKHGHEVMLGTRDPQKLSEWKAGAGSKASVGSFGDAAAFGEIVVVATHGASTVELLRAIDQKSFAGKTVIDATNPIVADADGFRMFVGFTDSLGEQVQRALPSARVVKAFNTVGAELMVDPSFEGGPADMFIAGNDDGAKARVAEIVKSFGWNVADMGGIEAARYLEPMCMTWVLYGRRTNTWNHAFRFARAKKEALI